LGNHDHDWLCGQRDLGSANQEVVTSSET
jgi:hypothetical protein